MHRLASLAAAALGLGMASAAGAGTLEERGAYLARIMDCAGCHTGGMLLGRPDPALHLAGSEVGFEIPGLGVFWPPNLTPDPETGLGGWSAEDIERALREGVRPDGRELAPAMPWRSYAGLNAADMEALVAYLRGVEPVRRAVPEPAGSGESASAPYLTVIVPKVGQPG